MKTKAKVKAVVPRSSVRLLPKTERLWGIAHSCGKGDRLELLYEAWHARRPDAYIGEPARPLLFETRKAARDWCAIENTRNAARSDFVRKWRFSLFPVTVTYHRRITPAPARANGKGRKG